MVSIPPKWLEIHHKLLKFTHISDGIRVNFPHPWSLTVKMAHVAVSFTDLYTTIETMEKQLMTATIHQQYYGGSCKTMFEIFQQIILHQKIYNTTPEFFQACFNMPDPNPEALSCTEVATLLLTCSSMQQLLALIPLYCAQPYTYNRQKKHLMYHMKSTGIIFACHAFYLVTSSGIVQIINASDVQQAVDTGLALVQTPWPCTKSFPPGLCSHPRPKDTDKNEDILPNSQLLKENNNKVELMLKLIILQPTAIISWCFNLLTKPQTYQIFIKSTILLPQPSIYHHSHTIIMILIDTLKHFLKLEIWTPLIRTEELKVRLLYLFQDICFPFVSILCLPLFSFYLLFDYLESR